MSEDAIIYLLLACVLGLAGFSAYRVSRSVRIAASVKFGSKGGWTCSIVAFIVSFAVFTVGMVMVFGVFFGRGPAPPPPDKPLRTQPVWDKP